MEWVKDAFTLVTKDRQILRFFPGSSELITVTEQCNDLKVHRHGLTNENDWETWAQSHLTRDDHHGDGNMRIILGQRKAEDSDSDPDSHNPALLSYVPFPERTFDDISNKLHIHGSLARVINRGYATFTRTHIDMRFPHQRAIGLIKFAEQTPFTNEVIVYNCRSSSNWPGDLALSMTYFVQSKTTNAILFGCDDKIMKKVKWRLRNAGDNVCHPLLLVGIFAELERTRQLALVKSHLDNLLDIASLLSQNEKVKDSSIDPWIDIYYLKIALQTWKKQLQKVVNHVDELSAIWREETCASFRDKEQRSGIRIKERILEIMDDYDEKISECEMIIEGMTLANSLGHSKANTSIAVATKEDSSQMRSIAFLTMVFLPATFVATLFSMTFFQWIPNDSDEIVSPFLWIYFVVALILTSFTVWLLRRLANSKKTTKSRVRDPEKALIPKALQSIFWKIEGAKRESEKLDDR